MNNEPPTISLNFIDLYNEAMSIDERLTVLRLAKCALIKKEAFAAACKIREIENDLRNASASFLRSLGKDLFTAKESK